MKFDDITAEAVSYGVKFYERRDASGRKILGYSVVREEDQITASMLQDGRRWRVAFRGLRFESGSKAKAADRALDIVANHD